MFVIIKVSKGSPPAVRTQKYLILIISPFCTSKFVVVQMPKEVQEGSQVSLLTLFPQFISLLFYLSSLTCHSHLYVLLCLSALNADCPSKLCYHNTGCYTSLTTHELSSFSRPVFISCVAVLESSGFASPPYICSVSAWCFCIFFFA